MSTTTEIRETVSDIVEALKQLPKEKQDYLNGYVQGIADASRIEDRDEPKSA